MNSILSVLGILCILSFFVLIGGEEIQELRALKEPVDVFQVLTKPDQHISLLEMNAPIPQEKPNENNRRRKN